MDTLSALDAEFLHMEDDVTTLHIGGVTAFEGPVPSPGDLADLLAAKLHLIPRYRQRVEGVPLGLGRPIWVDDADFRLADHLHRTTLPEPGDDEALQRLVGRIMATRLDRSRPLWEAWLVDGLPDGAWALIFKVHHCMVDGVAGVALLGALLDLDPGAELPHAESWRPEDAPGPARRVLGAWAGLAGDVLHLAEGVPRAVLDPVGTWHEVGATVSGLAGFGRHVAPTTPLAIEGHIGAERRWASASVPLATVKEVRGRHGGTVNDVVVAGVVAGLRDLLAALGDDPDGAEVRTCVPVSVRGDDGDGVPDNRVSILLVDLPVAEPDPLVRYAVVRAAMDEAKASHMCEVGETVVHLADLAPPFAMGIASRGLGWALGQVDQRTVNTIVTNVPGPQVPLFCLGRRMLRYLPYVPIAHGLRVGTAILSYDGGLAFGVTGDAASIPDPGILARGAVAGIEALAVSEPV